MKPPLGLASHDRLARTQPVAKMSEARRPSHRDTTDCGSLSPVAFSSKAALQDRVRQPKFTPRHHRVRHDNSPVWLSLSPDRQLRSALWGRFARYFGARWTSDISPGRGRGGGSATSGWVRDPNGHSRTRRGHQLRHRAQRYWMRAAYARHHRPHRGTYDWTRR